MTVVSLEMSDEPNKFPSHTWLPYLTPNGVTHLSCPLSPSKTDKIVHDFLRILTPLPVSGNPLSQCLTYHQ